MIHLSRQIEKIEKKEKKGSYGQWRRGFCKQYAKQLSKTRANAQDVLAGKLNEAGESISCRSGCTYCCYHYVTVSIAHGILIVDYLYKRKDLLKIFLDNYGKWHEQGYAVSENIDCTRNQALANSVPIQQVLERTRPLSKSYLDSHIPCPFLVSRRCAIYEVRPTSCSGHHSISPPEFCAPDSPEKPTIYNAAASDEDLIKTVKLADPRLSLYELSLPIMVYKLLTEGGKAVMDEAA